MTFIIPIYFQVKSVRNHTKAEKKKLAMAMRAKQLKAIGLQANEHGQVKADNSLLQQFVGLAEESGLCCSICREGYKFQPNKVKLSQENTEGMGVQNLPDIQMVKEFPVAKWFGFWPSFENSTHGPVYGHF